MTGWDRIVPEATSTNSRRTSTGGSLADGAGPDGVAEPAAATLADGDERGSTLDAERGDRLAVRRPPEADSNEVAIEGDHTATVAAEKSGNQVLLQGNKEDVAMQRDLAEDSKKTEQLSHRIHGRRCRDN